MTTVPEATPAAAAVIEQNPEHIYYAYVAIVVMALVPIWIGAHRSLTSKFGVNARALGWR
jgi:hypothetical protein